MFIKHICTCQAHPDAKKAWMTLIALMVDRIRHGFDKEAGKHQRFLKVGKTVSVEQFLEKCDERHTVAHVHTCIIFL